MRISCIWEREEEEEGGREHGLPAALTERRALMHCREKEKERERERERGRGLPTPQPRSKAKQRERERGNLCPQPWRKRKRERERERAVAILAQVDLPLPLWGALEDGPLGLLVVPSTPIGWTFLERGKA